MVKGELQKSEQAWTVRTRMTEAATGEVKWTASYSVNLADTDVQLQQSRLAAGVGHALALRINELLNADTRSAKNKVAIEQATAHINQTSPERFKAAQAMLEKALAEDPDNSDVQVALAALLMRGVQMVWLSGAEREAAETKAEATLQQTLRAKPNHIPAHEAYCRLLNATNQFRASLVPRQGLTLDPWNGIALFHIGLAEIQTGRFEDALATFKQADRFDTPQVSRWTRTLGAGWANLLMGEAEGAVPWLQKSIAITHASGRTHMLLAAAYQQLDKTDEARAAMEKGMELRPGSTYRNVPPRAKTPARFISKHPKRSCDRWWRPACRRARCNAPMALRSLQSSAQIAPSWRTLPFMTVIAIFVLWMSCGGISKMFLCQARSGPRACRPRSSRPCCHVRPGRRPRSCWRAEPHPSCSARQTATAAFGWAYRAPAGYPIWTASSGRSSCCSRRQPANPYPAICSRRDEEWNRRAGSALTVSNRIAARPPLLQY